MSTFVPILVNISQIIQASVSSTQKCTVGMAGAFLSRPPRAHHRRGGNQEAPRVQGAQEAPTEGIFLTNHHHSQTKCKKFPRLIILRCVSGDPSRKMLTQKRQCAGECFKAPWYKTVRTPTDSSVWRIKGTMCEMSWLNFEQACKRAGVLDLSWGV